MKNSSWRAALVPGSDRHPLCPSAEMIRRSTLILATLALLTLGFAQSDPPRGSGTSSNSPNGGKNDTVYPLRTLQHNAFKPGEKLTYVVHYGFMNAGEAVLELQENEREIQGRKVLRAVGVGRSLGAFNLFYKVDDHYETYFDRDGVFPWAFVRRVNEGGYEFSQDYLFIQHRHKVSTQKKETHDIPPHAQDMISAFYFARTIDFGKAEVGDVFNIDCFLDDENWPLGMRFIGRETIKVRSGKYRCLRFQPVVQKGRIFRDPDDLNVWVTDDGNHVPVLAQASVLVGSIKMELSSYEGLANPVSRVD